MPLAFTQEDFLGLRCTHIKMGFPFLNFTAISKCIQILLKSEVNITFAGNYNHVCVNATLEFLRC